MSEVSAPRWPEASGARSALRGGGGCLLGCASLQVSSAHGCPMVSGAGTCIPPCAVPSSLLQPVPCDGSLCSPCAAPCSGMGERGSTGRGCECLTPGCLNRYVSAEFLVSPFCVFTAKALFTSQLSTSGIQFEFIKKISKSAVCMKH